jgi:tetratricopeptide (TPR) repeat protein
MTAGVLLAAARLGAQTVSLEEGFNHYYSLEYDQAIAIFERAIERDPQSPDLRNYLAECLVFREMYRNGALESELVSGNNSFLRRARLNPSPEVERRFLDEVAAAMRLSQERLRRDSLDTGALYALGISHGLRSNYYWLVKKAWRDSLRDATSARKFHNRVSELDPANIDARLVQGLHDYIVGSLPLVYRMLGFIVGFHGDKERGIRTIERVAREGKRSRVDAEIFLCALYRRENRPRQAIPLVQDLVCRYPRNFLLRLELSQMYSQAGDGRRALEAVETMARLKREGAAGYDRLPWHKIWFQEGTIEFWYRDFDRALENMRRVTAAGEEVDLPTAVLAWLRTGQIHDLMGRRAKAVEAYNKAIACAPQAEAAQESRRYLAAPYRRAAH